MEEGSDPASFGRGGALCEIGQEPPLYDPGNETWKYKRRGKFGEIEERREVSPLSVEFIYTSPAEVAAWKSLISSVSMPCRNSKAEP